MAHKKFLCVCMGSPFCKRRTEFSNKLKSRPLSMFFQALSFQLCLLSHSFVSWALTLCCGPLNSLLFYFKPPSSLPNFILSKGLFQFTSAKLSLPCANFACSSIVVSVICLDLTVGSLRADPITHIYTTAYSLWCYYLVQSLAHCNS